MSKMKNLFESWRVYVSESNVVDLNRHGFNKAAYELHDWFKWLAYQDTDIDEEDPRYKEVIDEHAEELKLIFLSHFDSRDDLPIDEAIRLSLDKMGWSANYLIGSLGSLYQIMQDYNRRRSLL